MSNDREVVLDTRAWAASRDDLQAKLAMLRAMGAEPWRIVPLMQAEIAAEFTSARQRVYHGPTTEAWEWGVASTRPSEKQREMLAEIARQENAVVRALIGDEGVKALADQFRRNPQFAGISQAGLEALARIEVDFAGTRRTFVALSPEEARAADFSLEQDREKALRAALSPDDLAAYERQHSPLARQLKSALADGSFSDSEYAAIYRAASAMPAELSREQHTGLLAAVIAQEVDARTALHYVANRDPGFRDALDLLREGGVAEAEILGLYRVVVAGDPQGGAPALVADPYASLMAKVPEDVWLRLVTTTFGSRLLETRKEPR